jgi:hypothetical protein
VTELPGIVFPPTLGSEAGTAGLFTATGGAVGGVASKLPGCGVAGPAYTNCAPLINAPGAGTGAGAQTAPVLGSIAAEFN